MQHGAGLSTHHVSYLLSFELTSSFFVLPSPVTAFIFQEDTLARPPRCRCCCLLRSTPGKFCTLLIAAGI